MSYQITSDNIQISPSMTALATAKLEKLKKHLADYSDDLFSFRVVMNSAPTESFLVKIEADINGKSFFSTVTHSVLESALVEAVADVDRQMQKELKKTSSENWEKRREQKYFDPTA